MASSTDVGNEFDSPLVQRIRLAIVPMKASGNHDPLMSSVCQLRVAVFMQDIFKAIWYTVRIVHVKACADLDCAFAAFKLHIRLLLFGTVGVTVIGHHVDARILPRSP